MRRRFFPLRGDFFLTQSAQRGKHEGHGEGNTENAKRGNTEGAERETTENAKRGNTEGTTVL